MKETSKMYVENNQEIEKIIILKVQEIIPLFDTPHLIKGTSETARAYARSNIILEN
jgi:hypothetical protein